MSTIVQMPVRVKPPPADTGETISPGCASFEIAMPLNGARMIVLSRFGLLHARPAAPPPAPAASIAAMRAASESTSACALIDLRRRRQPSLTQLHASDRASRVLPPSRTSFSRDGLRRAASACASDSASAALDVRIVEPREHLAFRVTAMPFFDVHLDDLAGDLRRHGGAPPGRDVARGVAARRPARRPLVRLTVPTSTSTGRSRVTHFVAANPPAEEARAVATSRPSEGSLTVRLAFDAERGQFVFEIGHGSDRDAMVQSSVKSPRDPWAIGEGR
mgnify:CR=1 FL=1